MVCNESAFFTFSDFVFLVFFSSISWKAFNNLVLGFDCFIVLSSKIKLSSCVNNYISLYTKVNRLKNEQLLPCYHPEHCFKFQSLQQSLSLERWRKFSLNSLCKGNLPDWWKQEQLLAEMSLFSASLFSYLFMGKAFSSWSLLGESIW